MKNIFIDSVASCGYRMLDAQKFYNYFSQNNHHLVHNPKEADFIILITCGFSNDAANMSINIINKYKNYKGELIVAGCLPSIRPELINNNFQGKIITTNDLTRNQVKVDQVFSENKIKFNEIKDPNMIIFNENIGNPYERLKNRVNLLESTPSLSILSKIVIETIPIKIREHIINSLFGKHSIIHHHLTQYVQKSVCSLRVGWGCSCRCSYCGITKAIGSIVSKPVDHCVNEFRQVLNQGYKDFYLFSPDTGAYGLDIGTNLPTLLEKITDIKGEYEIFVGSINPIWFVKYIDSLEKILKKKKIEYMEFPIQSGSNRILKLMNRFSDIDKIKEVYKRLKKAYPDLKLYPHFMLGFPTETDEEFKKTLSLVKELGINGGRVFLCSCIPGTKAFELEPKISQEVLINRKKEFEKFLKQEGYKTIWPGGYGIFYKKFET